jgi:hypothetical protein
MVLDPGAHPHEERIRCNERADEEDTDRVNSVEPGARKKQWNFCIYVVGIV